MKNKDDNWNKSLVVLQFIGVIFMFFLAIIDSNLRPAIVGFLLGWLLTIRRKK